MVEGCVGRVGIGGGWGESEGWRLLRCSRGGRC